MCMFTVLCCMMFERLTKQLSKYFKISIKDVEACRLLELLPKLCYCNSQ